MNNNEQKQTKTDYKTGYIYSIRSNETDKIYIGSTFQRLSKRFHEHKARYKCFLKLGQTKNKISSKEILKYNNAYIELIKEVKVKNRQELNKYEGEAQRENKNILINYQIMARPEEEKKEIRRKYCKMIYEKTKKENPEKIKIRAIENYNKHKLIINKKKRDAPKIKCEICNIEIHKTEENRHKKSKRHNNLLSNINYYEDREIQRKMKNREYSKKYKIEHPEKIKLINKKSYEKRKIKNNKKL
tara:strand:- start:115 stop:846 length:732 start_codon:yes stop_codon:yes gene_type:complete